MSYVRGVSGYRRGMGDAGCPAGYQTSASDPSVCETIATFTAGDFCMSSSFPFLGQIDPTTFQCTPIVSPTVGVIVLGALALLMLRRR